MGLFSESTSSTVPVTVSPFGHLPTNIAQNLNRRQFGPLTQYFGFGLPSGSPGSHQAEKRLQNATGPLADLIRQFRGFAGGVPGQAQGVGNQIAGQGATAFADLQNSLGGYNQASQNFANLGGDFSNVNRNLAEVTAKGSAAYSTLQSQIDSALGALPGYQAQANRASEMAGQYAANAFAPVQNEDLYRTAHDRLTQGISGDAASRGALGLGSTQQGQTDATRDLVMQFRNAQDAQQQAAVPMQGQAASIAQQLSQAGVPLTQAGLEGALSLQPGAQQQVVNQLAQTENAQAFGQQQVANAQGGFANQQAVMESLPQLAQLLSSQYGIPMEAMGQVLQMLLSGSSGQQQLLQTTSPVVTSKSHSQSIGIL